LGEYKGESSLRIPSWLFAALAMFLLAVVVAPTADAQTLAVPLDIDGPRIFIRVHINDKRARLLLDTGAEITLVKPHFAKGTTELKRVNILQQSGMSQASIRLLSVTLGEVTLKNLVVGVLDMTDVTSRTGISMDGLLGEDILRRFRSVRINFKDKTLELER
jgi:predicted aspartyl protease